MPNIHDDYGGPGIEGVLRVVIVQAQARQAMAQQPDIYSPKHLPNDGGLGPVGFPMVSDINKTISRDYDVLIEDAGISLRGTFLIGKDGMVWHQYVNFLPLGRNVDEFVRLVEALQFHEENGEVCPAGWNKGDEGMKADAAGVADYLSKHADEL